MQKLSQLESKQAFINVSEIEAESAFLRYLYSWNNILMTHVCTLTSCLPQVNDEDDVQFRRDTYSSWGLPFTEPVFRESSR
jgi:hypothetical protein